MNPHYMSKSWKIKNMTLRDQTQITISLAKLTTKINKNYGRNTINRETPCDGIVGYSKANKS